MELFLKILATAFGFLSLCAAFYNIATAHSRAKQRDYENRQAAELAATTALAIRTQERVTGLEGRVGSIEQRIEKRMDQMGADITKVKDLFTDFLINLKS